ncbi:hypothetical protein [Thermospira aquatica]|uniref:NAD glycohydrolase translocation F5/8 type C domain-containing protein n=1 Tax=Thermospira aquatica TaxID=2828656 RepID=A0AAX3BAY7_9SPIR|nr:hypothetical protein [Thermospira aquatica]URA09417.1 hypothetical protein KDW03_07935 [Thermospira aquatica]
MKYLGIIMTIAVLLLLETNMAFTDNIIKIDRDAVWGTSYLSIDHIWHNIIDGNTNTCWAEGIDGDGSGTNGYMRVDSDVLDVVERMGVGEYIVIGVSMEGIAIDKIRIFNGYGKSVRTWEMNNRVKDIGITITYKKENDYKDFYWQCILNCVW